MCKKLIAFIMAVTTAIFLEGCKEKTEQKPVTYTGRYVEEEVPVPSDAFPVGEMFFYENNIAFTDNYCEYIYIYDKSNNSFTKKPFPDIYSLGKNIVDSSNAVSKSGDCFIAYYDIEQNNNLKYAYIENGKEWEKISLNIQAETLEFSQDERLFCNSLDGKVYEIDIASESAKPLFSTENSLTAFDVVNDYIIAVDSSDIYFYDYKKEELIDTPAVFSDFIKEQNPSGWGYLFDFCGGEDNSIYIVSEKGLYRYIIGGNMIEQLIDGYYCRLSNPLYSMSSVICDDDGSFWISYREGAIMRYHYDGDAVNKTVSALKIYSLTENATLSQIISEYKAQNPEVKVIQETVMSDGVTYDDALKNLTTAIFSDNAPDIIMLDGLDIDNYIEKNILLDLTGCESQWNPDNALLDNVAKWNNKGGLYSIACKFELPVLLGWENDLAEITDFSDFANIVRRKNGTNEGRITNLYTPEEVLDTGLRFMWNRIFVDDTINNDALMTLFNDCVNIYNADGADCSSYEIAEHLEICEWAESTITSRWQAFAGYNGANINEGLLKISIGKTAGFRFDMDMITSYDSLNQDLDYTLGLSTNKTIYTPTCNLGICTKGQNQDEAKQFLSIAISEQIQNVELYDGFPVNKNSLDYFYSRNSDDKEAIGVGLENDNTVTVVMQPMNKDEVNEFTEVINSLDTPIYIDTMTKQIIIDVGTQCLEGHLTTEEAVTEITRQLDLRMKE